MSALEIGLKHLTNASKTAKGVIDATVEVEIQKAMIDINGEIIAAQQSSISAQQEHSELLDRINTLEAEISEMKDWCAEAARYEEKIVSPQGGIVYTLKEAEQRGAPPHELCPNCFANGKKAIMQPTPEIAPRVRRRIHKCPSCGLELAYTNGRANGDDDPDGTPSRRPVVNRGSRTFGRS